jgi:diaminopimelate epimerase
VAAAQDPEVVKALCDRQFGVGGDGVLAVLPGDPGADARMRVLNADGSEAEMCGNGIRCVAKYVYDHGIQRRDTLQIETAGRVLSLDLQHANGHVHHVRVDMGEPILIPEKVPTTLRSADGPDRPAVNVPLAVGGKEFLVTCVSMGNPHCVVFVPEATDEWVLGIGPKVEIDSHFPKRVNVEFVELLSRRELRQRTWERGSGETYACGTGACAVCVAGVLTGRTDRQVSIHLRGGDLSIEWNENNNHVYMTGPAVEVFTGEWP